MRRNTFNFWIDLISFVVFFGLAVTGLLIHYVLPPCGNCTGGGGTAGTPTTLWGFGRHDFGRIHLYLALATVTLVLVHVCLHWTWVCCTFCKLVGLKASSAERCRLYGALILVLVIALAIGLLFLAKTQAQ